MRRPGLRLLIGIGGPAAAAAFGSIGSRRAPETYERLRKPSWAPPAALFGPAWTVLYTMIGVAGWRLRRRETGTAPIALHATQLALNTAWPFAFFAARDRRIAIGVISALDVAVVAEIVTAARVDRPAAALLGPYLAWSLYATALTVAVSDPGDA